MRRMLRDMQPTEFSEIVAVLALYRPGPMQFIPNYIDRKFGREAVTYHHAIAGADPARDLWHHRLSGADHPHRLRSGRLYRRRGRPDAPRRGQEEGKGAGAAARQIRARAPCRTAYPARRRPRRSLPTSRCSPTMALTRRTRPPMPSSRCRRPISRRTIPVEFMAATALGGARQPRKGGPVSSPRCRRLGIDVRPPDVNYSGVDFSSSQPSATSLERALPTAGRARAGHPLWPGGHQERGRWPGARRSCERGATAFRGPG